MLSLETVMVYRLVSLRRGIIALRLLADIAKAVAPFPENGF
jgi:hypothetical protein